MTSLDESTDFAKVLYYGPQGTGKTSAMASLAKLGLMWYVDAESGLKKRPLRNLGIPTENIEVKKPRTYSDYEALYWDLKSRLDDGERINLALDSYTEIQAQMVGEARDSRIAKNKKAGKTGDSIDPFFTDRDDYGKWTTQARELTRKFRDLPCHVAFGALQRRDQSSGSLVLLPDLSEKFRNDLMGYVDMIAATVTTESSYALDPEGIEYLGIFRAVGKYSGKDRFKITPVVMSNPTMDRLVALLNDELDLNDDPAQRAYLKRMAEKLDGQESIEDNEEEVAEDATAE